MRLPSIGSIAVAFWVAACALEMVATEIPFPASQAFRQEIALTLGPDSGLPAEPIVGLRIDAHGIPCVWTREGRLFRIEQPEGGYSSTQWQAIEPHHEPSPFDLRGILQLVQLHNGKIIALTETGQLVEHAPTGRWTPIVGPDCGTIHQIAAHPTDPLIAVASDRGLWLQESNTWNLLRPTDADMRAWGGGSIRGVVFAPDGRLAFASRAGVGIRQPVGTWRFLEAKDGLPWNDFTCMAAGPEGTIWFGTTKGLIRLQAGEWHYRQGPRWLPDDHVNAIAVDDDGNVWVSTPGGVGAIRFQPMTLAEKAAYYENEIDRWIRRTPLGYTAEAYLHTAGERASADPQDSDNDGLWTAMYGAAECFAFAATGRIEALNRARGVFEALSFLQEVTQGGEHAPPVGFVARTILPTSGPDPNRGRLERDRRHQQTADRLWKVYEPRWPKSASGKWYWKGDTSSDELDGHYFFYGLYYDLCAEDEAEKGRVRNVVAALTDHLLEHGLTLVDHDGRPTRWSVFAPQSLNRDPDWWVERGLNSLSVMSYLAVAAHVTGQNRYREACDQLVEQHGYAQNAMYPKVQNGPGSGNQSDDEMAFMCFYNLLRYTHNPELKTQMRTAFYRYWINESPERNPFFNFAYAAINQEQEGRNPFGPYSLSPWTGWHSDAMKTLYGFPLDRVNWPHQNSHRLDLIPLGPHAAQDFVEPDPVPRGHLADGKVLPIENRHFNHWNTDPWRLDYSGDGHVLGSGTVFLLPYYMGIYHSFIDRP